MIDRILIALLVMAAGVAAYLLLQGWQRRKASLAVAATISDATTVPGRPTILYFRSGHCAPCAAQSRYLDQLTGQLGDAVAVRKVDADIESDLASQFGVFTVPTTLVVDAAGQVRHANYGLADLGKLSAQVRHL